MSDLVHLAESVGVARRFLALDQATDCGWAVTIDRGVTITSGAVRLPTDTSISRGKRLRFFSQWLANMIARHDIEVIIYEKPNLGGRMALPAARFLLGLAALIELTADTLGCKLVEVASSSVKLHATGSGSAKKKDMVEAARLRGWIARTDDEADALWLLDSVLNPRGEDQNGARRPPPIRRKGVRKVRSGRDAG